jgi:SpoVK/Ycf46/Vps4 family AAA+-type ATPase
MWVGETEKAIRGAFAEAEREDGVLLFDEADSFLRSRAGAVRSWEVTQVNEFLQQLECFPGVVACTTNLWDTLDEAAMRRFVFKIEFRYLGPTQAWALFQVMLAPLAMDVPDMIREDLGRVASLAPGDFAAVRRRVLALGGSVSCRDLIAGLRAEVAARVGRRAPAGFR